MPLAHEIGLALSVYIGPDMPAYALTDTGACLFGETPTYAEDGRSVHGSIPTPPWERIADATYEVSGPGIF